ncbi:hypothetical protein IV203_009054 [Nitzschia inconspicua]|uniref:Uncharacterized protein n=1 Tax=Nitzschia inconspicua TaxID=303405 RepID=A0A9K3PNA1_9STRA|nr:hypothetical protein IV203_009054 [Nitzschia inconspicua]
MAAATTGNTGLDGRSQKLLIPRNVREEICREKKSYLNRVESREKERSYRRRSAVKKSVQNFLPSADKNSNPLFDDTEEQAWAGIEPSHGRAPKQSKTHRKSPNLISSFFLTPKQRKRERAIRNKEKLERRRAKEAAQIPQFIIHSGVSAVPLDESLSDLPSTDRTASIESSLGSGIEVGNFRAESVGTSSTTFSSAASKAKHNGSSSWKNKSRCWKKKTIPEDRPSDQILGIKELIELLPCDEEEADGNSAIVDVECRDNSSSAIHYIQEADWAGLDWNDLLLPSSKNSLHRQQFRRASCGGGTPTVTEDAAGTSRTKRGRRASCSFFREAF